MSSRTKIILGAFAAFILLGGGYLYFFGSGSTSTDTSAVSTTGTPASQAEVLFLNLSGQIDPITFDTSILKDPRFTSLVDIHTAILPETSGRNDPFSPVPGISTTGG